MNFVAQLEDYLRDLGAEARKKHPGTLWLVSIAKLQFRLLTSFCDINACIKSKTHKRNNYQPTKINQL
jgi:hypothetical protein